MLGASSNYLLSTKAGNRYFHLQKKEETYEFLNFFEFGLIGGESQHES